MRIKMQRGDDNQNARTASSQQSAEAAKVSSCARRSRLRLSSRAHGER